MSAETDAHVAIQQLLHCYADAVAHRNPEQWASTWAPDAEWDLGRGRSAVGIDAILELWRKAMGGIDGAIQTVLNGETHLGADGVTATGRWYIQEYVLRSDESRSVLFGHFDDAYCIVDGSWKFARRKLEAHYNGPIDMSGDFLCTAEALKSRGVEGVGV